MSLAYGQRPPPFRSPSEGDKGWRFTLFCASRGGYFTPVRKRLYEAWRADLSESQRKNKFWVPALFDEGWRP